MAGGGRLEKLLLSVAQPGREECDVFPKLYRANRPNKLRAALRAAAYSPIAIDTWESEPAYLGFSVPTLLCGALYQRLASAGFLPRATLMGFAQKPEVNSAS
jgi:hypothetical protein